MKKLLLMLTLMMTFAFMANAQFKIGLKGGMSTSDLDPNQLLIINAQSADEFGLTIKEANYGVHFGLFMQAQIGKFFLQPEVLFNSNSVDFSVQDFGDGIIQQAFNEKYQYLNIPVLMGFKFGPLRLGAGPVGHVFLNSKSELFDISNYDQKFDEMTYGWQAGVGLDIGKLMLDFRYEGNFNNFGDHIVFGEKAYQFDQQAGGFTASLGLSF